MPSRSILKASARQSIRGRKPSVFLIAVVYLIVLNALSSLDWHMCHPGANMLQIYISYIRNDPSLRPVWASTPLSGLTHIGVSLLTPALTAGICSVLLRVSRDCEAGFGNLLDGFRRYLKFLWLHILTVVYVSLWSLLLVVPGFIAIYSYGMAPFIMLDNPELSASECLRRSKELMRGRKLERFKLHLSLTGWFLLSILPVFGVLFRVYALPYIITADAVFYNCISGHNHKKVLKKQKSRVIRHGIFPIRSRCWVSCSNGFCFRNMIPNSFDYLIYPYYPAYTMGCYQFVISSDNKGSGFTICSAGLQL